MSGSDLYKIALSKIDGVGPVTARLLVSYCGSAEAIFKASKKAILKIPGVGAETYKAIKNPNVLLNAEKECQFLEKQNIKIKFYLDDAYPSRLKHFQEAPVLMYSKGNDCFNAVRTVGIVGTRSPSNYGKLNTEKLVEELKAFGAVVVSGLAHGVDAVAHRSCVQNKIPTIGIMGGGFEKIYPAANRNLAEGMLQDGAIATEFSYLEQPDREHFPMRNRVIAMLSDALVVIESGRKGGSMITAEFANRYNKDVFAYPGKISDKHSQGCNMLIKCHKAALIESAADIAYIQRWEEKEKPVQLSLALDELSDDEQVLIKILKENNEAHLDILHHHLQKPISAVSSLLLGLEFKGIIKSLPGKTYMLCR